MKKLTFFSIILIVHYAVAGQFTIQVGTKNYPSTRTWSFEGSGYVGSVNSKVKIGKIDTGGCLMLSVSLEKHVQFIKGSISLILNDTILVLAKTLSKDHFEESPTVLYSLDSKQYKILQKQEITEIRFIVQNINLKSDGLFTSSNLVWHEIDGIKHFLPKYKTSIEISQVMD